MTEVAWWAWFWGTIENLAFLGVVVALAIEFAALKLGAPYKEQLEAAKDLKIAELNNETAKLRERLAPRKIADKAAFLKALEGKPRPASFRVVYVKNDAESMTFAIEIFSLLVEAHWNADTPPLPISQSDEKYPDLFSKGPDALVAGGQATGVGLVVNKIPPDDAQAPVNFLQAAFLSALGSISLGSNETVPPDTIRVIVAPKG